MPSKFLKLSPLACFPPKCYTLTRGSNLAPSFVHLFHRPRPPSVRKALHEHQPSSFQQSSHSNLKHLQTFSTINVPCPRCPDRFSICTSGNRHSNHSHLLIPKKKISHVPCPRCPNHLIAHTPNDGFHPSIFHMQKNYKCPMSRLSPISLAHQNFNNKRTHIHTTLRKNHKCPMSPLSQLPTADPPTTIQIPTIHTHLQKEMSHVPVSQPTDLYTHPLLDSSPTS